MINYYKLFIIGDVRQEDRAEFEKCMNALTVYVDWEQFELVAYVDGNALELVEAWASSKGVRAKVSQMELNPHTDFFTAIIFWDGVEDIAVKRNLLVSKEYRLVRTDRWC